MKQVFRIGVLFVALTLGTVPVLAQSLEPRAYNNIPVGLNFLILGYGYSNGNVLLDPSVPIENAAVETHGFFLAYARSLDLWGKSAKFDFLLPGACVSGSARVAGLLRDREVCGTADPHFRLSVNLWGAPALQLKDFARYRQDTIVGVSLQISPPLGQYDTDRLLNIGTSRWAFKPEVGLSKAVGKYLLEITTGATFFSDNDRFHGGQERQQDPIYAIQGHVVYHFNHKFWGALNANYFWGGRTRVGSVEGNDLQENSRFGLTASYRLNRSHSIKCFGSTGVFTRTGSDFETIGFAWQYNWGDNKQ